MFANGKIFKETEGLRASIVALKQEHLEHLKFFEENKDKLIFKFYRESTQANIDKVLDDILRLEK